MKTVSEDSEFQYSGLRTLDYLKKLREPKFQLSIAHEELLVSTWKWKKDIQQVKRVQI
jgi:hypothetical protein